MLAVALLSMGWLIASFLLYRNLILDDPYITFRYGRNFLDGFGFRYNHTGPRVEGFTSPLWVFLSAAALKLNVHPFVLAKLTATLATLLAGAVLVHVIKKNGASFTGLLVAIYLFFTNPDVAYYAFSGMEHCLLLLVISLALLMLTREDKSVIERLVNCALLFATAFVLRPESLVFFAALFLCALINASEWKALGVRGFFQSHFLKSITTLAVILGFFGFRLYYFGSMLPNTYYAKHADHSLFNGLYQGVAYIGSLNGVWFVTLTLAGLSYFHSEKPHTPARNFAGLMIVMIVAYVVKAGGDDTSAFLGGRLMLPLLPCCVFLIGDAFKTQKRAHHLGICLFFAGVTLPAILITTKTYLGKNFDLTSLSSIADLKRSVFSGNQWEEEHPFSTYILQKMPKTSVIAVPWAGRIPYETQLATIDLLGLNDAHIARGPRRQSGIDVKYDEDYVLRQKPDLICENINLTHITSIEQLRAMSDKDLYAIGGFKLGVRSLLRHPFFVSHYEIDREGSNAINAGCFRRITP
jgi:arabinofuranosyltransferase